VAAVQNVLRVNKLDLERTYLDPDEKLQLDSLVKKFSDRFAMNTSELNRTSLVEHQINSGDYQLAYQAITQKGPPLSEGVGVLLCTRDVS